MRFSQDNKPYKIERDKYGAITIMTVVVGAPVEGFTLDCTQLWPAS